jgi:PilZ domain
MLSSDANRSGFTAKFIEPTDNIVIDDLTGAAPVRADSNRLGTQSRKYSRYARTDIQTAIVESRFFCRRKLVQVRLIDISQSGVAIACERKLKRGQRLCLVMVFDDGRLFEFSCVVANLRVSDDDTIYGLKFEKSNRLFEEHLLKTGLKIKLHNLAKTA